MSKKLHERYVQEFKKRNAKIPWKYYRKILVKEYRADLQKPSHSAGSKRTFLIKDKDIVFSVDEPHGGREFISKWEHIKVHDLFVRHGLIEIEKENKKN